MTTVLGIETSCDETAAAVVDDGRVVRSNVVASQTDFHRKFGGVVPEIASRAHIEALDSVIEEALAVAGCSGGSSGEWGVGSGEGRKASGKGVVGAGGGSAPAVDALAVTHRPGLVGALLIGVTAAKTLSWVWGKPLVGVDHVQAHAYSPAIGLEEPPWPAVGLIASGGHTSLYRITDSHHIDLLGATTDDAAGEAFDKVAAILGLPYPGGPSIERLAEEGDPKAVDFPRTMLGRDSLDFSFSGIKTAVLYHIHGQGKTSGGLEKRSRQELADIAASFQQAVVDMLIEKTMRAVYQTGIDTVVLGGGVAANKTLRTQLADICADRALSFHAAPMEYCTDNAAMIAALGYHQLMRGELAGLDLDAVATGRMSNVE